jgi:putative integral membrane protein (TIGR02587 family)
MIEFSHARSPAESLREYGRGIAGGLMFSLPLLFTMEVWWAGFILQPLRILFYVLATFILLLIYNRFAGLRHDASFAEVAIDSVEEMGIGLVLAAVILWLTDRIGMDDTIPEISGKIVMEAMTVAIGVSVGTAQLGANDDGDEGMGNSGDRDPKGYLPQVAIGLCGAVLFAANIAPTDEIEVLATEMSPWKITLLPLASLLLASLVLHFTDFRGAGTHASGDTGFLKIRSVITTYAVALAASGSSLWFFGKLDELPPIVGIGKIVILAIPSTLGASAGRLLLQSGNSKSTSK